jgi:YD repeat-containing protein
LLTDTVSFPLVNGTAGQSFHLLPGVVYTSPAGDSGTLTSAGGLFTYTLADGRLQTFNSNGYETSAISADGKAIVSYSYDVSNHLTGVATPDGALTTIAYSGGIAQTIKTGSRTVTLTMTGTDLTKITNPDGGMHTLGYDGSHHLTSEAFGGLSTTYAYSNGEVSSYTTGTYGAVAVNPVNAIGLSALAADMHSSVVHGLGRTTRYLLDTSGRMTQQIAPDGGITTLTLNGSGFVTSITDPLNQITTITRDSAGFATTITNADGTTNNSKYQVAFHALTQYTDELTNLATYAYDVSGHMTSSQDATGAYTTMTYNAGTGLLETVTDPLNHVTTYLYDASRRLQTTIYPDTSRATLTYDSNGNVATSVDVLGRTTTYTNDALGRVTKMVDPSGLTTTYAYDGAGQMTSMTDPVTGVTNFTIDPAGNTTATIEGVGTSTQRSTLATFDAAQQNTATRDPNGNTRQMGYNVDSANNKTTDALGNVSKTITDLAGQVTGFLDQLGNLSKSAFDKMGRVTTSTDALGNISTTVYDNAGRVIQTINANNVTTSYAYDKDGRQTVMTEAVGTAVPPENAILAEGYRRHDEEVDGGQAADMVLEKGLPGLRGRLADAHYVLRHRRFGDVMPEQVQLGLDARRSPAGVFS